MSNSTPTPAAVPSSSTTTTTSTTSTSIKTGIVADHVLKQYIYNNQLVPTSYKKTSLLREAIDKGRKNNGILKVAVDVDSCWDKLIGCSKKELHLAPWQTIFDNLQHLLRTSDASNLDLVFMFNGTTTTGAHGTNLPAPPFLLESMRLILRSLGVSCRATVENHQLELIKYVTKHHLHGILTCDPGLVAHEEALEIKIWCGLKFKPPQAFQPAHQQWRGYSQLETHELCTETVINHLKLDKARFFLLIRLLLDPHIGKCLLEHWREPMKSLQVPSGLLEYIRDLGALDADSIAKGFSAVVQKHELRSQIHDHLLKYKAPGRKKVSAGPPKESKQPQSQPHDSTTKSASSSDNPTAAIPSSKSNSNSANSPSASQNSTAEGENGETEVETETDLSNELQSMSLATDNDSTFLVAPILQRLKEEADSTPTTQQLEEQEEPRPQSTDQQSYLLLDIDQILSDEHEDADTSDNEEHDNEEHDNDDQDDDQVDQDHPQDQNTSSSADAEPSPNASTVEPELKNAVENLDRQNGDPTTNESTPAPTTTAARSEKGTNASTDILKPSRKVETVTFTRHTSGLMHPAILQLYRTNSIQLPRLPVVPRGGGSNNSQTDWNRVFQTLRAKVYAILFNSNHMKFIGRPVQINVREFGVLERLQKEQDVGWSIPTVERLWFGEDCRQKRIRAFFNAANSERESLMDPDVVPQHLLILVVALRCIVVCPDRVIKRSELDAFLLQSLLMETRMASGHSGGTGSGGRTQALIQLLSTALVHLLMLNDAVGAPIPFQLFLPHQFFDGALFAQVVAQLSRQSSAEICGPTLVVQMERLRMAVLDGLHAKFMEGDGIDLQQRRGVGHGYGHGLGRIPSLAAVAQLQRNPPTRVPRIPPTTAAALGGGIVGGFGAASRRLAAAAAFPPPPLPLNYGGGRGGGRQGVPVPLNTFSRSSYYGAGADQHLHAHANAQLHVAGQVVGEWGLERNSFRGGQRPWNSAVVSRQAYERVARNPVQGQQGQFGRGGAGGGGKKKGPGNMKKAKKPGTSGSGTNNGTTTATATATPPHPVPLFPGPGPITIKTKPTTPTSSTSSPTTNTEGGSSSTTTPPTAPSTTTDPATSTSPIKIAKPKRNTETPPGVQVINLD